MLLCLLLLLALPVGAQRNFRQPIGETVADHPGGHYRFQSFTHESADGQRRWRIRIGVPENIPDSQPRPSIWMLDGNAALIEFDANVLADLAGRNAPVLVFLGHDNDWRIDTEQRWRDYTPSQTPPDQPRRHPDGGADAFLETLERDLVPEVERRARIDPAQRLLWGHSLGGLFVLHTLFRRPGLFGIYVAGSPSLWWRGGEPLRDAERFVAHNAGRRARLWLMQGEAERLPRTDGTGNDNPRAQAFRTLTASAGPDATRRLARLLASTPGLTVHYREFAGLGHGPAFRASLMATLSAFSGIGDHGPRPHRPDTRDDGIGEPP